MTRLFTALALPDGLRSSLSFLKIGLPGARWIAPAELHLTLRFIGEVDGGFEADLPDILAQVTASPFEVTLEGVGQFGDKKPHTLFAGVRPSEPLSRLAAKIEQACQRAGLAPEPRRYTPHVTLARLKACPPVRLANYLADHGLFRAPPFAAMAFVLYSSHLGHEGAHYRVEAVFPLTPR